MATTRHNVIVELDACNVPTSSFVMWESGSDEFILTEKCAPKVEVGKQFPLENEPTASQYGMFSRKNNGTCSEVSGSDSFLIQGISGSGYQDTESFHQEIHARRGGTTGETLAFHSEVPIRMQYSSESGIYPQKQPVEYPASVNYPFPDYPTTPVSYDYIFATRSGALTAGLKTDFISFQLDGGYLGSSSYLDTDMVSVGNSFSYARIHHTARVVQAGVQRTQVCTHHVAWTKTAGSTPTFSTTVNSIEEARIPVNQVIIDPSLTTATLDNIVNNVNTGATTYGFTLNLNIYHYDVDYAYHVFKYTLL